VIILIDEKQKKKIEETIIELKINDLSIDQIINVLAEAGDYQGPIVGIGNNISSIYASFFYLKRIITIDQCVDLIKTHPSSVVKFYIFEALIEKDPSKLFEMILFFLKDWQVVVKMWFYDSSTRMSLPDYFIEKGFDFLTTEQKQKIIFEIEKNDYRLQFRKKMYNFLESKDLDHDVLRNQIVNSMDANGLDLLAKFKNKDDVQVIKDSIKKNPILAYSAISLFPDPSFWDILAEKYQEEWNRENYWSSLHKAIIAFRKSESKLLIINGLNKIENEYLLENHAIIIFRLIKDESMDNYADLYLLIWDKTGTISFKVFEFLKTNYYSIVLRIIESKFSDSNSLYKQEKNSEKFLAGKNEGIKENLLTIELLTTLYMENKEKTVKLLLIHFDSYLVTNINSVCKFIINFDIPELIDKMFTRAKSDGNTNVRIILVEYLRSTNNSAYISRVNSLLKDNPTLLNYT
jgi:hypothetical protein